MKRLIKNAINQQINLSNGEASEPRILLSSEGHF